MGFVLGNQGTKVPRILRVAREDLAADAPPERTPDRVGADVPAIAAPDGAHRPENSLGVADIEDVRVAVGEESSRLAVRLLFEKLPDAGEGCLRLVSQLGQDLLVQRVLFQHVVAEFHF